MVNSYHATSLATTGTANQMTSERPSVIRYRWPQPNSSRRHGARGGGFARSSLKCPDAGSRDPISLRSGSTKTAVTQRPCFVLADRGQYRRRFATRLPLGASRQTIFGYVSSGVPIHSSDRSTRNRVTAAQCVS